MTDIFKKTVFWWIISLLGFGLLTICYILAWHGEVSYALFWVGMGVSCFSLLFVVLLGRNKIHILFTLFILGLVIYSVHIYRNIDYFIARDEMHRFQVYNTIIEDGFIDKEHTTFPISAYYPGMEILISVLSKITALKPIVSAKTIAGFVHSLDLLILCLFFNNISKFSISIAGLATFIYAINPRFVLFDAQVSYETMAITLVILLFLLIQYKLHNQNTVGIFIISLLTLFSLIVTHHSSPYMFIFYIMITSLLIYYDKLRNKVSFKSVDTFFMLSTVATFSWLIYVATSTIGYVAGNIIYKALHIIYAGAFEGKGTEAVLSMATSYVPIYETIPKRFFFPPTLIILCGLGVFLFLKYYYKQHMLKFPESTALLLWSLPIFFLSWPLTISTGFGAELGYRVWAFAFIGVAFVSSLTYYYLWNRKNRAYKFFIVSTLIVLFISGISLGRPDITRLPAEKPVSLTSFYNLDLFKAADWLRASAGKKLNVAGTEAVWDIVGGYGAQKVSLLPSADLFLKEKIDDDFIKIVKNFNYIVADQRITKLLYTEPGDLFHRNNISEQCRGNLPDAAIEKFNNYCGISKVYANGNIKIYRREG